MTTQTTWGRQFCNQSLIDCQVQNNRLDGKFYPVAFCILIRVNKVPGAEPKLSNLTLGAT